MLLCTVCKQATSSSKATRTSQSTHCSREREEEKKPTLRLRRLVDILPAIDHDAVSGNIARMCRRPAREERPSANGEESGSSFPKCAFFPPSTTSEKRLSRDAQEDDGRSDLDRLTGASERDAVGALEILRKTGCPVSTRSPSLYWYRRRTSRENVAGTSGVRIGPVFSSPTDTVSYARAEGEGRNEPGATALTRTPFSACWFARPRVKATIAPLVEVCRFHREVSGRRVDWRTKQVIRT